MQKDQIYLLLQSSHCFGLGASPHCSQCSLERGDALWLYIIESYQYRISFITQLQQNYELQLLLRDIELALLKNIDSTGLGVKMDSYCVLCVASSIKVYHHLLSSFNKLQLTFTISGRASIMVMHHFANESSSLFIKHKLSFQVGLSNISILYHYHETSYGSINIQFIYIQIQLFGISLLWRLTLVVISWF